MSAARRFPFGQEPVAIRGPEEPPSRTTDPLVGFAAPAIVVQSRTAPPAIAAASVPLPRPELVRPRKRRAGCAWIVVALAVLVVLEAALLLLVVWGLR